MKTAEFRHRAGAGCARVAAFLFATIVTSVTVAPVQASQNVFHIFTPTVEAGHWGVEAVAGFNWGRPSSEGAEKPPPRMAVELGLHAGLTEFWMSKLALGVEEDGGSLAVTSIALENVFRFSRVASAPLDFAWFTALGAGLESGSTNVVEFGPIVSYTVGPASLVLNPFFEKTFGENREEGIAFTYAWRLAYQVSHKLSVGVEGYGEIENLGNTPPVRDQIHRIGPVLYLGTLHGAHSSSRGHGAHNSVAGGHHHREYAGRGHGEWHAEIGVLFGLTEATPDTALKLNVGIEF